MLERMDGETREIAAGLGVRIVQTAESGATVASANMAEEVKIVLNEARIDSRMAEARLEAKVLASCFNAKGKGQNQKGQNQLGEGKGQDKRKGRGNHGRGK